MQTPPGYRIFRHSPRFLYKSWENWAFNHEEKWNKDDDSGGTLGFVPVSDPQPTRPNPFRGASKAHRPSPGRNKEIPQPIDRTDVTLTTFGGDKRILSEYRCWKCKSSDLELILDDKYSKTFLCNRCGKESIKAKPLDPATYVDRVEEFDSRVEEFEREIERSLRSETIMQPTELNDEGLEELSKQLTDLKVANAISDEMLLKLTPMLPPMDACPVCGSKLWIKGSDSNYTCQNPKCRAKFVNLA